MWTIFSGTSCIARYRPHCGGHSVSLDLAIFDLCRFPLPISPIFRLQTRLGSLKIGKPRNNTNSITRPRKKNIYGRLDRCIVTYSWACDNISHARVRSIRKFFSILSKTYASEILMSSRRSWRKVT